MNTVYVELKLQFLLKLEFKIFIFLHQFMITVCRKSVPSIKQKIILPLTDQVI